MAAQQRDRTARHVPDDLRRPPSEEPEVRKRIEDGLRQEFGWVVLETRRREVAAEEQPLAERLASA